MESKNRGMAKFQVTNNDHNQTSMTQQERMNFIGEMAAGMSHEIRNPITTVRGFLQMLSQKERNPRNQEYFDLMIEELDRVNVIITEYLSLAKDKPISLEDTNLNEVIQSVHPSLKEAALADGKGVVLELEGIPYLRVDEKEIRKLITNLATNGLEAMDSGGQLVIRTYTQDKAVILEVEDEGSGMDPDVYAKIGTPFFSTKENATGLGLAVCYSIANRHQAKINIYTSPGGSTFQVVFSLHQQSNSNQ